MECLLTASWPLLFLSLISDISRWFLHQPGLDTIVSKGTSRKELDQGVLMKVDFNSLDATIATYMHRYGVGALRISLGIIFFWFGILKPFGISAAQPLVEATVGWMPFLSPTGWVQVIGWWEVLIGVAFLFRSTTRIAIALLAMQMVGTFLPLVILPEVTFQAGRFPYGPTMEGQYIIKNLLIISAALVIGGTVRERKEKVLVDA